MKILTLATAILVAVASASHAACDVAAIETALAAALDHVPAVEITASEPASTEGGSWSVHREKDGRLNSIIRTDYGETGRQETRLSVVNRGTYGVASTRIDYLRHAFIENAGPNGVARKTTENFFFCDGKLLLPPAESATVDLKAYDKSGAELLQLMRDNDDIKQFTIGLKR